VVTQTAIPYLEIPLPQLSSDCEAGFTFFCFYGRSRDTVNWNIESAVFSESLALWTLFIIRNPK
jgi:hypothetical protein